MITEPLFHEEEPRTARTAARAHLLPSYANEAETLWTDGRETRPLLVLLKRFHMQALLFIPSSVSPVIYQPPPALTHTHTP